MAKIIVTGGAGFIGSHISRRLVKDKHKVTIIDNLCEGNLKNIADIRSKVKFHKKNILDLDFLYKAFNSIDYVFHQAALRSVPRSVEKPIPTNKVNIEGTLNVLMAARKNKAIRVIFASSSSVYGDQKADILKESLCTNPLSPYALSKLAGEVYLKQFYSLYDLDTISLRYFNVFGPYQDPENEYAAVIPIFITKMLKNQTPTIHWDGKQSRDFTYIDDVVEANILAMKAKKTKGEIVNVSEGKTVSINQLFNTIQKILQTNLKPQYIPKREGDIRKTLGNTSKAKKLINFQTKISFSQGIKKTVNWFR
ncbi:SDR family oxidoreductase [Patescibacteria group bacterium]